jgi:bifunctional UDP-N-acetylglucosamine pyrophosphorylase/glucosamine-1-phosphate N-acetyltransferase
MDSIAVVILAAGKGTRMGQDMPKVLSKTAEKSLICHVLDYTSSLNPQKTILVTGYKSAEVKEAVNAANTSGLGELAFAMQENQNGTGDAVRSALPLLKDFSGTVVILYGDVPLIKADTLQDLVATHRENKATVTLISLKGDVSNAYGRIIRNASGAIERITELKDCTITEKFVDETNSGIYAVDSAFLEPAIDALTNDNAQKEYYLTDIVEKAATEGQTVASMAVFDASEIQGVNTKSDLMLVNQTLRQRRIVELLKQDVLIEDPASLYLEPTVSIAPGARIGPNVTLKGNTTIATGAVLEGSAYLVDTTVAESATIRFGVRCESAHIGPNAAVGPFAHLRPGSELGEDVRVGNFVETKKAVLHSGVKAGHLSYLGDCEVYPNVNIGAGTIFANYDGVNKHKTTVKAGAFIGSNSVLVAPIEIGEKATVGAGSTLTKDVEANSLALTRAEVKELPGWKRK